jgi:hypothetical protein
MGMKQPSIWSKWIAGFWPAFGALTVLLPLYVAVLGVILVVRVLFGLEPLAPSSHLIAAIAVLIAGPLAVPVAWPDLCPPEPSEAERPNQQA